jgi:glycosyltransferase involved in cell wall biosynthesis
MESRALLMPSRGEGFGLAYLEAMRLGRPCLVGNDDAGREVVSPPTCGLEVDPADRTGLAAAVVRLLSGGTEWQAMADAAFQRFSLEYTEKAFVARLSESLAGGRDR